MTKITMTVNGKQMSGDVEGRTLLAAFLREDLRLTGTHIGCDTSQCGACVVHVNGQAVKACTMFAAEADGADVATIEGQANADGSLPAGVSGPSRATMRFLHTGHGDVSSGAVERQTKAVRERGQRIP